jgi:hypothetical protein
VKKACPYIKTILLTIILLAANSFNACPQKLKPGGPQDLSFFSTVDETDQPYAVSNLVLSGTRETNAIIEKFADKLPLHLKADAKDYGLLYIFPVNNHYVLINSGLPWWTPPKLGCTTSISFSYYDCCDRRY